MKRLLSQKNKFSLLSNLVKLIGAFFPLLSAEALAGYCPDALGYMQKTSEEVFPMLLYASYSNSRIRRADQFDRVLASVKPIATCQDGDPTVLNGTSVALRCSNGTIVKKSTTTRSCPGHHVGHDFECALQRFWSEDSWEFQDKSGNSYRHSGSGWSSVYLCEGDINGPPPWRLPQFNVFVNTNKSVREFRYISFDAGEYIIYIVQKKAAQYVPKPPAPAPNL